MKAASSTTSSVGLKPVLYRCHRFDDGAVPEFEAGQPVGDGTVGLACLPPKQFRHPKEALGLSLCWGHDKDFAAGDGDGSVGNKERNRCCLARLPTAKEDLPGMV